MLGERIPQLNCEQLLVSLSGPGRQPHWTYIGYSMYDIEYNYSLQHVTGKLISELHATG
jgi:hypothetical protein